MKVPIRPSIMSPAQFMCSSGVCIPMESRCDNINDCADKTDEANCNRVNISDN